MRSDDVVPLLTRRPPAAVGFRQGVVLAWDPLSATNAIEVGGTVVSNIRPLNSAEAAVIRPGDRVSILTIGDGAKSWFVVGRTTTPGDAEPQIAQSADYDPGNSGWTVNRDGSAEFQDIIARGDLQVNTLLAGTPGGARVELTPTNFLQVYDSSDVLVAELNSDRLRVFGDNNSYASLIPDLPQAGLNLAALTFQPPDPTAPHTVSALGSVFAFVSGGVTPQLTIQSPSLDGELPAAIFLIGGQSDSPSRTITLAATSVNIGGTTATVAGDLIVQGGPVPCRLATTNASSVSGITTTETVIATLTANVKAGYTYRLKAIINGQTGTAGDIVSFRVREDNVSGTTVRGGVTPVRMETTGAGTYMIEREFEAASTVSSKSYVVTAVRTSGSGSFQTFSSQCRYTLDQIGVTGV